MTTTTNIITREEALRIAKPYVEFVENHKFDNFSDIIKKFENLKRGQTVISYRDGNFRRAKVTSINHNDPRVIDGPIVRVSDGEYSWRVDGCDYAYPI